MAGCANCGEELEEGFDACWSCGADMDGNVNQEFQHADQVEVESDMAPMKFVGRLMGIHVESDEARKPVTKWDVVLPGWSYPLFIGLFIFGLAIWLSPPNAKQNVAPAYIFAGLCIVASAFSFFMSRRQ